MLKKILIAVAAVVVLLLIVIAMQPATFSVSRSVTVAASPADVFPFINDFHKMDQWSPWMKIDPNVKTTYAGAPAGQGAVFSWVGNSDVGEGRETILDSKLNERVAIKLEFIKPFESVADVELTLAPSGTGTTVTWLMKGDNNFLSKAMCLFMGGMDKMIGPDFEKGLAQLKTLAEAGPKK